MKQDIPVRLAEQMNCGSPRAVPRVANNRITNRRGPFGLPAHQPSGNDPTSDGGSSSPTPNTTPTGGGGTPTGGGGTPTGGGGTPTGGGGTPTGGGGTPTGGGGTPTGGGGTPTGGGGTPTGGGDNSRPPNKAERMEELGLNHDNMQDLPQSFHDHLTDYYQEHGPDGDWSGYTPNLD